jgi:hypothetical protein
MDLSLSVGILALILAIPMAVLANMLTPRVQNWWASTSVKRRQKRIARLQGQLNALLASSEVIPPGKSPASLRQPVIKPTGISSLTLDQNIRASALYFQNIEQRYPTTAHNLKASIIYRPFYGDELKVPRACWMYVTRASNPRTVYVDSVNIGMLESKAVLLLLQQDECFYTLRYANTGDAYDDQSILADQPMQCGEWTVQIKIGGDNYIQEFPYKLILRPDGGCDWTSVTE